MKDNEGTNNKENGGLIASLLMAAVGIIGEVYRARNKDRSEQDQKQSNDAALVRATKQTACATKVIAVAAIVTFVAAVCQAIIFNRQLEVMRSALVDVERPVLFATLGDMTIQFMKPVIQVHVENVGKQTAIVHIANGSLVVQRQTDPGPTLPPFQNGGSHCKTFTIGEWVIRPGPENAKSITCERQLPLTLEEADGITHKTMFAFFKTSFVYDDPLGFSRTSGRNFLLVSNTKFVDVGAEDDTPSKLTNEQRSRNQRILVDALLQINKTQNFPIPSQ